MAALLKGSSEYKVTRVLSLPESSEDELLEDEHNTESDDNWEEGEEEAEREGEFDESEEEEEDEEGEEEEEEEMVVDKVNGDSDVDPGNESEEE
ncbi:hypothetical protein GDO81_022509 [Engystomops pustulosus]|uniref:Uncharacterized protein n=1 Tax=Engystomops pustulosus TaxID=76066 RepID=A0AAV6YX03_ENGPU|nr:hypothetical protein GDO81_022509 [Engystomops pustulosus]